MRSAIRKVCRVLHLDPEAVPANPARLRVMLEPITAAAAGVTSGRWANTRSLVRRAIERAGIRSMPGRYRDPLIAEWEALRALLPNRHLKAAVSSLLSYLSAHDIPPFAVTAEIFAQFAAALMATSLKRDPGGVYRDACKAWNWAAEHVPGWPQLRVPVPSRSRQFAFGLEQFPQSFQADVNRFLSDRTNPDVFSDDYQKPLSPATNKGRRQHILVAATALVKTGFPIANITGLDVLVELDNAKAALRFLHQRADTKKTGYIHHIATLLKTIARYFIHKDEKTVEGLREISRKLNPGKGGFTEKNRACLRQFADPGKLEALLMLPRRVFAEAEKTSGDRRKEAVRAALALTVAFELVIPLRDWDLRGLCFGRHLHRSGDQVFISVRASKNGSLIEGVLPPWLIRLLDTYLKCYRSRLISAPCPWLFPGENNNRRSSGFGVQIKDFLADEIGVKMTLHQFRHLACKLYLDRNPCDFETVRLLLGHKSVETTRRFYAEMEAVLAVRRYGELITRLLDELHVGRKGRDDV
jgi:integrase